METTRRAIAGVVLALMMTGSQVANAQFAGDVFFIDPSVAVPAGETATIEVAAFTGAYTFGAAHVDLVYDPAKLAIVSVRPGSTTELQDGFSYRQQEGMLSIVTLNGVSERRPIGTISLALVEVRPLMPAGSVVRVDSNVHAVLRHDSGEFASPQGFDLEIAVTNPQPKVTGFASLQAKNASVASEPVESADGELYERAVQLRPEGSVVVMMVLDGDNNARPVTVRTGDPTIADE